MSTISMVLLTGGSGFFSRLANVRLLAATRELRDMEESRTRVPMEHGTMAHGKASCPSPRRESPLRHDGCNRLWPREQL